MTIFNEKFIHAAKLRTVYIFKLQECLTGFCINGKETINL